MPKNILPETIERRIHAIRGENVMLDGDLASLYGVPTKVLNQAVRRNFSRFPGDFMFRLTATEVASSRSQIVTLKRGQNVKYLPYAFTENGVAMLSSVLRSERAIQVNIEIMRTFVRLKRVLASNVELARKIEELEKRCKGRHSSVLREIGKLLLPDPEAPVPKIRFAKESA